jgi:hypothetical protein
VALLDLQIQQFEPPNQAEGTLIQCSSEISEDHDINATVQGILEALQKRDVSPGSPVFLCVHPHT